MEEDKNFRGLSDTLLLSFMVLLFCLVVIALFNQDVIHQYRDRYVFSKKPVDISLQDKNQAMQLVKPVWRVLAIEPVLSPNNISPGYRLKLQSTKLGQDRRYQIIKLVFTADFAAGTVEKLDFINQYFGRKSIKIKLSFFERTNMSRPISVSKYLVINHIWVEDNSPFVLNSKS